ncbi:MAG: hypothetical protein E7476_03745 [Ruminococcaceae bacterium]|nr:hypothetical protein [Oscillospiraceae bacterium]
MPYIPTYTIKEHSRQYLLVRKLATFERHFYRPEDYLYDGSGFWLVLDSSDDQCPVELKLRDLLETAEKYAESEGLDVIEPGWNLSFL